MGRLWASVARLMIGIPFDVPPAIEAGIAMPELWPPANWIWIAVERGLARLVTTSAPSALCVAITTSSEICGVEEGMMIVLPSLVLTGISVTPSSPSLDSFPEEEESCSVIGTMLPLIDTGMTEVDPELVVIGTVSSTEVESPAEVVSIVITADISSPTSGGGSISAVSTVVTSCSIAVVVSTSIAVTSPLIAVDDSMCYKSLKRGKMNITTWITT